MKVIVWLLSKRRPQGYQAIKTLEKIDGSFECVGVLDTGNLLNGKSAIINRKPAPVIAKEDVGSLDYDLILGCGFKVQMANVIRAVRNWNVDIDLDRFILDRTVCVPGFSLERWRRLKQSRLTIFAQLCWGGLAYNTFGLQFLSPTINLWFEPNDFFKLLSNPHHYFSQELSYFGTTWSIAPRYQYPVYLADDIKIYFSHYRDATQREQARADWLKRREKINYDNVLAVMHTDNPEELAKFDRLPFEKKACFTNFESDLPSAFYIPPKFFNAKRFWTVTNNTARNSVQCFDMWDLLLDGKKTPINR